jgi:neutral ceramidase
MGVVEVAWSGGSLGRDRPVGAPFVIVQRAVDDSWRDVITDLDIGLLWREQLGTGRYRAHLDIAHDLAEGTYRFRIDSERYQLTTGSFRAVASDGIRLLGALADHRRGNRMRVRLFAQNPPPDPEANLRSRPVYPQGGVVRFHLDGRDHEARWEDAARAWVAAVPATADGARLEVPARGLEDGLGNTSGDPVSLVLGQVAELDWPPHLGPAGGRPPGPLGIGTFPP